MRLTIVALALAVLFVSCAEDNIKSNDIVTEIPWPEQETATYRLLDDGEEVGTLQMTSEGLGDFFTLRQHFEFPDDRFDAERLRVTMKKIGSRRIRRTVPLRQTSRAGIVPFPAGGNESPRHAVFMVDPEAPSCDRDDITMAGPGGKATVGRGRRAETAGGADGKKSARHQECEHSPPGRTATDPRKGHPHSPPLSACPAEGSIPLRYSAASSGGVGLM